MLSGYALNLLISKISNYKPNYCQIIFPVIAFISSLIICYQSFHFFKNYAEESQSRKYLINNIVEKLKNKTIQLFQISGQKL